MKLKLIQWIRVCCLLLTRKALLILTILATCVASTAQEIEKKAEKSFVNSGETAKTTFLLNNSEENKLQEVNSVLLKKNKGKMLAAPDFRKSHAGNKEKDFPISDFSDRAGQNNKKDAAGAANPKNKIIDETAPEIKNRFHWKAALIQSGIFLGFQHSARMLQKKTTRELGGPFFPDWAQSVKNLRGWKDGDSFITNYVGHPMQGGLTGRIFINNSDKAKRQIFGNSADYWKSRFKALIWSAAWSTQFELGPISEASIGNVGKRKNRPGQNEMAWGDLIITPVVGTAIVVGEDAVDKYIFKNWLEKKAGRATMKIKIIRCFLTPTTSIGNLLRWKEPWRRENR